jgi:16S rRNA A1518/A1519 N6-dimethyltransferase RsmA/KsgA/DIM1 with predicted DNA glycosylase/AP lyase activity
VGLATGRSVEVAREDVRAALRKAGLGEDARAEALAPEDFVRLARTLAGPRAAENRDGGAGS